MTVNLDDATEKDEAPPPTVAASMNSSSPKDDTFDWLTSAASLDSILPEVLETSCPSCEEHEPGGSRGAVVVDMGSGSSLLGQYLASSDRYSTLISKVINVDVDEKSLQLMEERWESYCDTSNTPRDRLEFLATDFARDTVPLPSGSVDMCIDKSTLDFCLCGEAAVGLLMEVYRLLRPNGGTYVIVSFHHVALLRALLQELPGADWDVSYSTTCRVGKQMCSKAEPQSSTSSLHQPDPLATPSVWATGSFQPDNAYRETVNVVTCRRCGTNENKNLDQQAVTIHLQQTLNDWFRTKYPLLTEARRQQLYSAFHSRPQLQMELPECYQILFTDAEREHLTYEFFLEDWTAFLERHAELTAQSSMSYDTAVRFLEETQ